MCNCTWCGDSIEGPVAMMGQEPMHEHCCAEYNAQMYPENGDSWECDDILYGPEDEDFEDDYGDDECDYDYCDYDDDDRYDDDPSPYGGY